MIGRPVAAALCLYVALGAGRQEPAGTEGTGDRLYVASQAAAAVSIIDIDSLEVIETIQLTELGFTVNAKPHHVAVEPDGSYWYVSLISDGRVLKFDRANELAAEAEFETPGMLAVDPVEDVLYVGRSMAAVNPPPRIGVIRRSTMAIDEYDVFFPRPHAIVAAPGGGLVYTASLAENRLAAAEPATEQIELVRVPGTIHTFVQLALSPDGTTLVTGGQISGTVLVFDITDRFHPKLEHTLEIGGEPWHPSYSVDGSKVYFPQRTANSVAVIDTASWELVETIRGNGLAEPHGSAISPDGRYLFVSGRNTTGTYEPKSGPAGGEPPGTVVVIDTDTLEIVTVLEVPAYAAGIGTRPAR